MALRLQKEIPGGIILDQYNNVCSTRIHKLSGYSCCAHKLNNPLAHELTTAPEIIAAVTSTPSTPTYPSSGKVDVVIAGAGTGGTITGVARGIKKAHNKDCIVVGVDPVRRTTSSPELAHFRSYRSDPLSLSLSLSMRQAKANRSSSKASGMTLRQL